jgi:hypothetical protein
MAKQSTESRILTTTTQVMDALGGVKAVSGLTRRRYGVVENWKRAPTFPAYVFAVMTWALKRKGLSAPPSLWRQVTTAEMEKAAA